jgi:glyoxylase-like metal-dependent hydrolase (beta-lactamase superfamily II)
MAAAFEPRVVKAGNRGPFTLDGTRTFLVGRKPAVVIDPGPNVDQHVRALSHALADSHDIHILLTHGHGDHAAAAGPLAGRLGGAPILGPPSAGFSPLEDGQRIPFDQGELVTVLTPGHTSDHVAFYWPRARALFAGDLILGRGSTTWLGEYPGCIADYLESLDRVQRLDLEVIYPTHGPPVRDPQRVLESFRDHRLDRLKQVARILYEKPDASVEELVLGVYGSELPPRLVKAAASSIDVMLHHLR